jgi:hypothetical protein
LCWHCRIPLSAAALPLVVSAYLQLWYRSIHPRIFQFNSMPVFAFSLYSPLSTPCLGMCIWPNFFALCLDFLTEADCLFLRTSAGYPVGRMCSAGENSRDSRDAGAGAGARIAKSARDSRRDSRRIRHLSTVIPAHSGAFTRVLAARCARAYTQRQACRTDLENVANHKSGHIWSKLHGNTRINKAAPMV